MDKQEFGELIVTESLKEQINKLGNDEVWRIIEDMSIARQRSRYRKFFFKAGGELPKRR